MLADKMADKHEITEFFLPRDLNYFCLGCYKCIEDKTKCPFYEEKKIIETAIEKSELLIFTTPTYCLRASAPMKSLIDLTFANWMPHSPRAYMFQKKAVVISTAAGAGTKQAIKDIKTSLFYCGVPYIKTYGICVQAMRWEDVVDKKKEKIGKDISKLSKKIMHTDIPKVGIKTKIIFNVMAKMQKADMGASPVEKKYWQDNGWFDEKRPWNSK